MSDATERTGRVVASTRRSRWISPIWIIPIVAIVIGLWLAWTTLSKEGPTITVSFETAEGMQVGQSQLKYKDMTLGTVKALTFTPDHERVVVTIGTTSAIKDLLTDDTLFWVVKPRLFAGNVSGLDTLLSGAYVGMRPGKSTSRSKRDFVGSEDPPVLQVNVPGRTFTLKAQRIGSISLGSPVFFRDLQVGQVLGWELGQAAESVTIHAFVRAPFDTYVDNETRFWNASGISLKLGSSGVDLQLESVKALILGGIAFDAPPVRISPTIERTSVEFPLFSDRETANAASYSRKLTVISYFQGSMRGLGPGADVLMRGLKVGQVDDVHLEYDKKKDAIVAPVRFSFYPERIIGVGAQAVFPSVAEAAQMMVSRGLRAQLETASLLTGQQLVSLVIDPKAPPATAQIEGQYIILPTIDSGGFSSLEASAGALLDNVNAIPFAQIGSSLSGILQSVNEIAGSAKTEKAVTDFAGTIRDLQSLVQKLDGGIGPSMKQLPEITSNLQRTVANANRLLQSFNAGYGENTKFNRDLERLLVQLNDAVRSIRSLADLLTRHPEALIKGRAGGGLE